jgi:hypothetical protein
MFKLLGVLVFLGFCGALTIACPPIGIGLLLLVVVLKVLFK